MNHRFARLDEIDIHELEREPMVVLSQKFGVEYYREFMEGFQLDGIVPNIVKEVDTLDDLLFSAKMGEGIILVSRQIIKDEKLKMVSLINTKRSSNYAIGYHRENSNPYVPLFVKTIKEHFIQNNY